MVDLLWFEQVVRMAGQLSNAAPTEIAEHPFDTRNVHPIIAGLVRRLFDDGHYSHATLEAFKYIDKVVQHHTGTGEFGAKLMMQVFGGPAPRVRLTPLSTPSEQSEQEGYKFLFAGSMQAIRNPRAHDYAVADDLDSCLDHLCLASMLLRRLVDAGYATI